MSPKKRQEIGAMVKRLREARDMTQLELATKAGVPQGYISELEAGKKKNPGLDVLLKLAQALQVKPARLLE